MRTIPRSSQKYGKYIILFGIFLAVAGLVSGVISGQQSLISIALATGGLAVVLAGAILWGSGPQGFFNQYSAREGTNALLSTLSAIAILGLLNFLAVRYSTRVDLTETQLFTLSPQSQEIVANLPKPLKVVVFDPTPEASDRQLLENYSRQGANFQYEFVDPQVKIGLAREFGVEAPKAVYLQYGDRKQQVQAFRNEQELLAEIPLTSGIEKMLRQTQPLAYFLQGHGEWPLEEGIEEGSLSQAVNALTQKGYDVKPLNLAQQSGIPADADAIAIFGPKRALFAGEVTALKEYLDRGGSLLVAIDPKIDAGLDPILRDWGVKLDERLVVDASGSGSTFKLGPATPLVTQYGVHPITAAFRNSISVYPLARPIETESKKDIQPFPLIETGEESWAESNLESDNLEFNPDSDLQGPLTLGVALSKRQSPTSAAENQPGAKAEAQAPLPTPTASPDAAPTPQTLPLNPNPLANPGESSPPPQESRLVVLGNSTFALNGWFDFQINSDVFLNSVEWLAKNDESPLSISPKQPKNRRLNLTIGQANLLGWLAMFIVPFLSLAIALFAAWRRR